MDYLLYSSKEMFSSTELIRKSKMIFDKLANHEINKAIILRDGKPSFIMLDFDTYEKIMREFNVVDSCNQPTIEKKIDSNIKSVKKCKTQDIDEESELLKTLEALDNMEFEELKELKSLDDFDENEAYDYEDEDIKEEIEEKSTNNVPPLKEFWEK
ncbi:MAG: hypothetical protein RBQ81_05110 [Arcobacteraceae bacterium]|jgi:PHD/YefM family antitoxin component YafN of YafNO toxin-antitoxin module|nr:hypothetical protein [Arcobacteraceae bacterium]MDY0365220.1 hypothetical protein [Arcobacteraceae bacterium]